MKKLGTMAMAGMMWGGMAGTAWPAARPADLRCEYLDNPLGIDVVKPRLSWVMENSESEIPRGTRQTAYQVLVASSERLLAQDTGDLWDSGKVAGAQSNQLEYRGKALASRLRCEWKVRVWDQDGKPSAWSQPASWGMGLLQPGDWTATWIGHDAAYQPSPEVAADDRLFNVQGLQWFRMPGDKAGVNACFRKRVDLPADRPIRRAVLALYAYHFCEAAVNGTAIGTGAHWERTARLDAGKALHAGANVVTLVASHTDPYPPAVIGRLVVQFASGDDLVVPVDKTWKVSPEPAANWQKPDFDDAAWPNAEAGGYQFGNLADIARVPAPYLRKDFSVAQAVKRATVYVTALGAYELRLNGKRVGKDVLAPGWTEFRKRVHYQTYDVTAQVGPGANAIGAILGDGWYASDLAHLGRRNVYGGRPRFLAQLVMELADGTTQVVVSDPTWKASYGPIKHADLLIGCEYDARLEMAGWDQAGFNDKTWQPVETSAADEGQADVTNIVARAVKDGRIALKVENELLGSDPAPGQVKALVLDYQMGGKQETKVVDEHGLLDLNGADLRIVRARYGKRSNNEQRFRVQAAVAEPSRVMNELPALKVTEPKPGCWTFDLGQNMVGWVRLKVRGTAGQRLTVRHGEKINADGTIYTAALRSCPATDYFILSGKGEETLEPCFTFHGFQYVEVRGLTAKPDPGMVTGMVVHTPMRRTGSFECSHPLLNQLYSNIIWGQKGNYLEVPTDCPQRDERMGWTGDTQFFAPTAAYNFDVAAFFTRWLQTCEDNQSGDGSFPHVVPDIMGGGGATAWGDAALLCTYNIYHAYGDTRIVAERFDAMERYMKWLDGKTKDGISKVGGFGDWLNAGGGAKAEAMDTAYHAYLARIMAAMAKAIGREDDARRYAKLHDEVKAAFVREFLQADGSLKDCSQTGYALAFTMDLLPANMRAKAAAKFVDEIKRFDWHLATGFIGTPRLLPALSAAGRDDVAYRLLLTDTYPSWLFPVKNGATTMWERWNGWTPDQGFGDIGMNSFNHYAFGAVGEYLYGGVGGIKAASPGYQKIIIKPAIGDGLTWAKTSFVSVYGLIASDWKRDAGRLTMDVTIPPNTTATVHVPVPAKAGEGGAATAAAAVTESGKPAGKSPGVKFLRMENGAAEYGVESGVYHFASGQ
ncbi:MAG: glycoside hydrolase family 78 protein [Verrucomicrobia bacterium]|nr:glycoside hydrolase family 78 protein [Verrucomicrobiota bacterium]